MVAILQVISPALQSFGGGSDNGHRSDFSDLILHRYELGRTCPQGLRQLEVDVEFAYSRGRNAFYSAALYRFFFRELQRKLRPTCLDRPQVHSDPFPCLTLTSTLQSSNSQA